ncbi:hypothetical protein [Liberiplasma polymorphum]|uniref:hypothetical protein n=1 Tax=Liberiplasma polymorphum TaxID=3374570 RepID=UPI0037737343
MSQTQFIAGVIGLLPKDAIHDLKKFYDQQMHQYTTESIYLKTISRLAEKKIITKVMRSHYYIPKKDSTRLTPTAWKVRAYILEDASKYVEIGDALYFRKKISLKTPEVTSYFVNDMDTQTKSILSFKFTNIKTPLTNTVKTHIELLDILSNYDSMPYVIHHRFLQLMESYSNQFCEDTFHIIYNEFKYKKKTIAFLCEVLDHYNITHDLRSLLSAASTYHVPDWKTNGCEYIESAKKVYKNILGR